MGFRTGAYAKVWDAKPSPSGRSTSVRLSISKKNKETGAYEDDFSGYANFIATAHTRAGGLKSGDRIKLGDVDVSSTYNRETKAKNFSFKVFSFEPAEGGQGAQKPSGGAPGAGKEDDLPDDFPG